MYKGYSVKVFRALMRVNEITIDQFCNRLGITRQAFHVATTNENIKCIERTMLLYSLLLDKMLEEKYVDGNSTYKFDMVDEVPEDNYNSREKIDLILSANDISLNDLSKILGVSASTIPPTLRNMNNCTCREKTIRRYNSAINKLLEEKIENDGYILVPWKMN